MGIVFSKCTRVHNFKFCENLSCYDYAATDDETGFLTVFGATKAKWYSNHINPAFLPDKALSLLHRVPQVLKFRN